jgi:hypothetical protein
VFVTLVASGKGPLEENMEKKVAGLLGAVAALGALNGAQAAPVPAPNPGPPDTLKVNSYADLLEPIPNALKVLAEIEAQAPVKPWEDNVKVAQFYHHHHHHGYYHHHHHGYGPRVIVVPPRRYYRHHHHGYYHHHHHHHHGYYRY